FTHWLIRHGDGRTPGGSCTALVAPGGFVRVSAVATRRWPWLLIIVLFQSSIATVAALIAARLDTRIVFDAGAKTVSSLRKYLWSATESVEENRTQRRKARSRMMTIS